MSRKGDEVEGKSRELDILKRYSTTICGLGQTKQGIRTWSLEQNELVTQLRCQVLGGAPFSKGVSSLSSQLLLRYKLPQSQWLKTTHIYWVTVSVGQELEAAYLAVWFGLSLSRGCISVSRTAVTWASAGSAAQLPMSLTWWLARGFPCLPGLLTAWFPGREE